MTTTPLHLGRRLVVFAHTTRCELHDHPADIVTDGHVFYATTPSTDIDTITRDGSRLHATCPEPINADPMHEGDPCGSTIVWDLAAEHWTANPQDINDLEAYGDPNQSRRVTR